MNLGEEIPMPLLHSTKTAIIAVAITALLAAVPAFAGWQDKYPTIHFGVLTLENHTATVDRYKIYIDYAEKKLGVKIKLFQASDYAGVGEALMAGHLQMARIGGAGYASAWLDCKGCIEPLVTTEGLDGTTGYFSILTVRADSPYKTLADLKGKSVAFADPNSTSGYIVPMVTLTKSGINPKAFFAKTSFSGGHEQSVLGLLKGTYDAVYTWTSEGDSFGNLRMMMDKGLLQRDQVRVVDKSEPIRNPLLAVRKDLPQQMKKDIAQMYFDMEKENKQVLRAAAQGDVKRYVPVTHEDYVTQVEARKFLRDSRKKK
jgi:phosphonate transport system substrate-binding protein